MSITTAIPVSLESGDRLTREEFHRRYCKRPDIRRAELIQGVVYVASPARYDQHDSPASMMVAWLKNYTINRPGVRSGGSPTIFLSADSEVQPDAVLFYDPPSWSGGIRRTDNGYLTGAPELVVEVAASTVSYDLHDKMESYRLAGVQEYIAWRVLDHEIDWFRLRDGVYVRLEPDQHGVIESEVFPGLRLAVARALADDFAGMIAEIRTPPAGGAASS
jgi:Uma2 family endonuclease